MTIQSRITNCYIHARDGASEPMFSDGGGVRVRLDSYAIIPREQYERLVLLAEMSAERIAANTINRASRGETS